MSKAVKFLAYGIVVFFLAQGKIFAQDLIQEPAAIHISSTVSDGTLSIPEIIKAARQNNIKIVMTTDRDSMKWEYGFLPLRNILKKTVQEKSVSTFGIPRYLGLIESLQRSNPDTILIAGFESAPYYYWQGSFFKNNLQLHNWHKHFLVFGLDKAGDIEKLPVIGNQLGLRDGVRFFLFWPLFLIALGLAYTRKRKYKIRGGLFLAVGVIFLINNWPFCAMKFDQYGPEPGVMPYQNFISYVKDRGGLSFWAHAEAKNSQWYGGIKIETPAHVADLLATLDYSGYSVFYEGYKEIGSPGGIWDEVLLQYCKGIRKKPVWAIAGLSFDSAGNLNDYMKDVRTVLLLREFSKGEVLKSLREGRVYALRGKDSSKFILKVFMVKTPDGVSGAIMGQEVVVKGNPLIEIAGHFSDGQDLPVTIRLIKNGTIIETFQRQSPFSITYTDTDSKSARKSYYRIEVEAQGVLCVSNPIFMIQNTI